MLRRKTLEEENKSSWTSCLAGPQNSRLTPDRNAAIWGSKVLSLVAKIVILIDFFFFLV